MNKRAKLEHRMVLAVALVAAASITVLAIAEFLFGDPFVAAIDGAMAVALIVAVITGERASRLTGPIAILQLALVGGGMTIVVVTSGSATGVLIIAPVFVFLFALLGPTGRPGLIATAVWTMIGVGLALIGSHHPPLVAFDLQWISLSPYRMSLAACLTAAALAIAYRRAIDAGISHSTRLSEQLALAAADARRHETQLAALAELAADWFWETDADGRLVLLSENVAAHTGYEARRLAGLSMAEFYDAISDQRADHHELVQVIAGRDPFQQIMVQWQHGDQTIAFAQSGVPQYQDNGEFAGFRGSARNVSARHQLEASLTRKTDIDALTGVYSKEACLRYLQHGLNRQQRAGGRCSLALLEVGGLDQVVRAHSQEGAERVLRVLGSQLLRCCACAGRLSGDRFLAFWETNSISSVRQRLQRIVAAVDDMALGLTTPQIKIGLEHQSPVIESNPGYWLINADRSLARNNALCGVEDSAHTGAAS